MSGLNFSEKETRKLIKSPSICLLKMESSFKSGGRYIFQCESLLSRLLNIIVSCHTWQGLNLRMGIRISAISVSSAPDNLAPAEDAGVNFRKSIMVKNLVTRGIGRRGTEVEAHNKSELDLSQFSLHQLQTTFLPCC